jgi:transcriptional regulator GlxA family with amidase domain
MLIFPGVQSLDVSGPMDTLAEATALLPPGEGYEVTLIGPDLSQFRASNGMRIAADLSYAQAKGPYDLFLVAGGPALPTADPDLQMIDCIRRLARVSRVFGSVCTGAFCLGDAGLLDGKRVTTHWQDAGRLASRFPAASVEPDTIYLRDGTLVTSAGVTAGIDLALALVREDYGAKTSLAVAKRLVVVAQRQGGQSQFSPYVTVAALDSPIAQVASHLMANLAGKLSVGDLASVAGMSTRTFARAFVAQTGITPAEFVERARIDAARNALEGHEQPLKVVAHECGFGTPKRLRQAFVKHLGITPLQYRERFAV